MSIQVKQIRFTSEHGRAIEVGLWVDSEGELTVNAVDDACSIDWLTLRDAVRFSHAIRKLGVWSRSADGKNRIAKMRAVA